MRSPLVHRVVHATKSLPRTNRAEAASAAQAGEVEQPAFKGSIREFFGEISPWLFIFCHREELETSDRVNEGEGNINGTGGWEEFMQQMREGFDPVVAAGPR